MRRSWYLVGILLHLEGGIRKRATMYLAGCLPYQKNGVVVRHLVGYGRLVGDHVCRQLAELYRALRLYVNCFQPSMKLVAKHVEGRRVRQVYDAAKTPAARR